MCQQLNVSQIVCLSSAVKILRWTFVPDKHVLRSLTKMISHEQLQLPTFTIYINYFRYWLFHCSYDTSISYDTRMISHQRRYTTDKVCSVCLGKTYREYTSPVIYRTNERDCMKNQNSLFAIPCWSFCRSRQKFAWFIYFFSYLFWWTLFIYWEHFYRGQEV